jgi:hypothetical protein
MRYCNSTGKVSEFSNVTLKALSDDTVGFSAGRFSGLIRIDSIVSLSKSEGGRKVFESVVGGAIGLGAAGYLIGTLVRNDKSSDTYYSSSKEDSELQVVLTVVGAAAGGSLGAFLAPPIESQEYQLSLLSHEEKIQTLQMILNTEDVLSDSKRDVVYLKNGSIIRGSLAAVVPDSVVKIQTADGSLFVFRMSEVEKIVKEEVHRVDKKPALHDLSESNGSKEIGYFEAGSERPVSFSLLAGAGIPAGDYSNGTNVGFACRGEVNYHLSETLGWATSATASFNGPKNVPSSYDVGSFSSVFLLTGLRFEVPAQGRSGLYLQGQLGLLIGGTPSVSASVVGITATQPSASGTAFGYGIGAGVIVNDRFHLSINFLKGTPEVTVTASGGGYAYSSKGEIPFSIILIGAGVSF